MSKRLYIAGPMTGLPDFNYPAFFEAEEMIRALGHTPLNPGRNDGKTVEDAVKFAGDPDNPAHPWEYYLRRDIPKVVSADGLVMLPGWQNSRGANLEVHIATSLSMPLYILRDGKLEPRITVIGLSGYAQSGKDTIGAALETRGYQRVAFADRIREGLYALDPMLKHDNTRVVELVDSYGWEHAKTSEPEVRSLLQKLGSEVGRNLLGENVWVDLTLKNAPDGAKIVVTDCRFENEAAAIKRLGGQMWRVKRPGYAPVNSHPSETALDDWNFDAWFENNSTIEDLHVNVFNYLEKENL